jgi:hypothetical protein
MKGDDEFVFQVLNCGLVCLCCDVLIPNGVSG